MTPELKIVRNNVSAFFRSLDERSRADMVNVVQLAGVKLANLARTTTEMSEIHVLTGKLQANTVAFPAKVSAGNVTVRVGVKRPAFYAAILAKGVPHSWTIEPHRWSNKSLSRGSRNLRALRTPYGPKASVIHPALRKFPFLRDAANAFRPEFRADILQAAKRLTGTA